MSKSKDKKTKAKKDRPQRGKSVPVSFPDRLRTIFGLDPRSLSLFRITVGALLIGDLIFRYQTLVEMYTDDGFFTRAISYRVQETRIGGEGGLEWVWSFHWLSGDPFFQTVLFVFAGVVAFLLMIGWQTKLATILSWAMLVSIHNRNPLVLSSGDFLLKMALFWSIFLPLGRYWSVDAWRAARKFAGQIQNSVRRSGRVVSFASAAFIFQLFAMYFFSGVAKWNDDWWSGEAMQYVLHTDIYVTSFGQKLLDYPLLLKLTSYATVTTEVFLICFLFSSWNNAWLRMLNLIVFWSFHVGIGLSMNIGLFPVICMVVWLGILPTEFWGFVPGKSSRKSPQESEPEPDPATIPRPRSGRRKWILAADVFCAVGIVYMLLWNIFNIEAIGARERVGHWFHRPGVMLNFEQHFQMFGRPSRASQWFEYEATLANGECVDIFRDRTIEVRGQKTGVSSEWMSNFHWRRMHRHLVLDFRSEFRQPLGEYFVNRWNAGHSPDEQIKRFRLFCYQIKTGPEFDELSNSSKVWSSYPPDGDPKTAGSVFDSLDDADDLGGLGLGF